MDRPKVTEGLVCGVWTHLEVVEARLEPLPEEHAQEAVGGVP